MAGSPTKSRYYVVYDGAWMIQCDGENSEPYLRRNDAFKGQAHGVNDVGRNLRD